MRDATDRCAGKYVNRRCGNLRGFSVILKQKYAKAKKTKGGELRWRAIPNGQI